MALGELQLPEQEFWDTTLRSLMNRVRGVSKHRENLQREEWDRTRWAAAALMSMWSKDRIRPLDLIKFPWDDVSNQGPLSLEERQKRFGDMDKKMKQLLDNG